MRYYQPNHACNCRRCSTRGLMGPAVLVTLGVLFLLANTSQFPFERTWPILLIVIGVIQVARYAMPDSGHLNPGQYPPPYAGAGQYPPPPYPGPVVTPPPPPVAGTLGDGKEEHGEVHNG